MQNNRWLQTLIVILVIIASFYLAGLVLSFVSQFSSIILLFFLSWLLAFVLRPVARWLTGRGTPYGLSVGVVYLGLAILFTVGGFLLVPAITTQIADLIRNFNNYALQLGTIVTDVENTLNAWGVRDVDLDRFYQDLAGQAQEIGLNVLQNTFTVLQSVATLALQLILMLILSFYFMKDGEALFGGMLRLLPPQWQDEAKLLGVSIERSFGAFVRGQLVFAFVYALLTAAVMIGFGLEYVVIASIVAGLSMIIPLVGNYIAFIPPMLVTLISKPDMWLWVLIALFIVQSFVMNFVGPRIMSQAIGIHPLYVMAAILIGGQIGGFWGGLFGIPIAGVINLVGRPLLRRIRHQTTLYKETASDQLTTRAFVTGPLRASLVEEEEQRRASVAAASQAAHVEVGVERQVERVVETRTALLPPDDLEDEDLPYRRPPTLTGRAWHLAWVAVSRAYSWVGTRANPRTTRQG